MLKILSSGISEESIEKFADFVEKNLPTQGNMRGSAGYRSHLAGVLTKRALININK